MPSEKRPKTPNPASQPVQMAAKLGLDLANAENYKTFGRILGLDLELVNTGLVLLTDRGHVLRSTTFHYPLVSTKKMVVTELDRITRILDLANEIVGVVKTFKPRHIAIEAGGASFRAKSQALQRGGLLYVVSTQIWLACHLIPEFVAANSARKVVLGYGAAKKADVKEAVRLNQVGLEAEHEIDAYIVARWMYEREKGKA